MKKIILYSAVISLVVSQVFAQTSTLSSEIMDARVSFAQQLNDSIEVLKNEFVQAEDSLLSEQSALQQQYDDAIKLKSRVTDAEINPTVLTQGLAAIEDCGASQELFWTGTDWECRLVDSEAGCSPNGVESVEEDGSSSICNLPGSPTLINTGLWGECIGGVMKTQTSCVFESDNIDPTTGEKLSYQIPESECEGQTVETYSTPCGANSICSCPAGTYFREYSGKGYCLASMSCPPGTTPSGANCVTGGSTGLGWYTNDGGLWYYARTSIPTGVSTVRYAFDNMSGPISVSGVGSAYITGNNCGGGCTMHTSGNFSVGGAGSLTFSSARGAPSGSISYSGSVPKTCSMGTYNSTFGACFVSIAPVCNN